MNRSLFLTSTGSLALVGAAPRIAPRVAKYHMQLPTFAQIAAKWNAKHPHNPLDDPAPPPGDPYDGDDPEADAQVVAYTNGYTTTVSYTGPDWGNLDGTAFTISGPTFTYNVQWRCVKATLEAGAALTAFAKVIIEQGPKVFGERLFYAAIDFDLGDLSLYAFALILGADLGVPVISLLGTGALVGFAIWGALGCPHYE